MEKVSIKKLINPQPKQLEALEYLLTPECKYLLYGGAMSGGKSYLLRWGALSFAIYLYLKTGIKSIPIGLFSEDYPTLKDRQISRIDREFPPWLGELKNTEIDGLCFQIAPEYGSGKLLLRNLDDPSKYMSTEFAGEFVEELTRNEEQTFWDLRNRLRYPGIDEVKFMGASNPGGIGHAWVKKFFIEKKSEDPEQNRFFYVHATAYDNKYISQEYIKQLESLPTQQRKAFLEGSWDIFAGQFFDEWNQRLHVIRPFIPSNTQLIVGGMDYGWTAPTAIYFGTVEKIYFENYKPFFRIKIFSEIYGNRKTPKEWTEAIKEKVKFFKLELKDISWIRADPAIFKKKEDGSIGIADMFHQEKIELEPADNDRLEGAQMFHNWLSIAPDGLPYLQIASNCENAIRTIPALIHDENKTDDVDTLSEDHAYDAIRYLIRHVKWVQPQGVGAVPQNQKILYKKPMAWMYGGRQVSVDLKAFQDIHKKSTRVVAPKDMR